MQSSYFIYNQHDQAVARNNLLAMAQDVGTQDKVGVASNNSGWCHAFAPLRQFLADPRFIRLLRKYKARYYYNERVQPNEEFLKAMYGTNYNTEQHVINVFHILTTLCKHTDAYGRLLPVQDQYKKYDYTFNTGRKTIQKHVDSPYAYLIKLVHRIFPDGEQNYTRDMYNYLSDCTAIMSESPKILACKDTENIYPGKPIDLKEIREDLEKGLCITAAANGHHVFNIYKDDQNKYRLLGVREEWRRPFDRLIYAIQSIQPKAYTPEQQYWLCEKITEKQLGKNKKAGINKYLEKHTSYLNQQNNQHGFNNKNNQFKINNNIMNQNNFGFSNNQQNNMNMMMSNMNILNRNGNNNMINQRNINNINNFNNNMMGHNMMGNNMINQHNFGPQPINNMMMGNMNIMNRNGNNMMMNNNNVNLNMRQGNRMSNNQQGRNFK